jgi:hypothetical protein
VEVMGRLLRCHLSLTLALTLPLRVVLREVLQAGFPTRADLKAVTILHTALHMPHQLALLPAFLASVHLLAGKLHLSKPFLS